MRESEKLTLVDQNDRVVGSFDRSLLETLMVPTANRYLRTSVAFLRNADGEIWTPRRVGSKSIAPDGLDFSMAEHVGCSKSYLEAAVRGFGEELRMNVTANDLRLVGKLGPMLKLHLPYFSTLFVCRGDKAPDFNREDFTGGEWLTPQQIVQRIEDGDKAKSLLLPAIKLLLLLEGKL